MIEGSLAGRLADAAEGRLGAEPLTSRSEPHVGVVLASQGYPGAVTTGIPITGLDEAEAVDGVRVFHAGTELRDGRIVTAGGRVLTVVGTGPTYEQAIARAYSGVSKISFAGMQFRRDIGRKALTVAQLPESPELPESERQPASRVQGGGQ
jgi:phosphoribosylamine--glycine ligase